VPAASLYTLFLPTISINSSDFLEDSMWFWLQRVPAGVPELGDALGDGRDAHGGTRDQAAS
jgi:hypothetical protein